MMTPKEIAALDQANMEVADHLPLALGPFYRACIVEGFPPDHALELTKTLMIRFIYTQPWKSPPTDTPDAP